MSTQNKILIALTVIALIGFILYSSTGLAQVKCEVCMEFQGRRSCRPAFGSNREEAVNTATSVACADLASGRDDSIACQDLTPPKSVTCSE